MKPIFNFFLFVLLINSCKPPTVQEECSNPNIKILKNENYKIGNDVSFKALILNEGGYTYGNASITKWNLTENVEQNVFQVKNGYSIGDVLQSYYIDEVSNELYLLLNNSQKIEVIDKRNLQRLKTITGFTSPRYMTIISSAIFVTDLYSNTIYIVDINGCESKIDMKGWTEQIFKLGNILYVIERSEVGASNLFANLVRIEIDFSENEIKSTILSRTSLVVEPQSIFMDNENNLWLLSSGKESEEEYPTITKFNTSTNSIEKKITYNSFLNIPQNFTGDINKSENLMFYNQGTKIYKINNTANIFPTDHFIETTAENIYNINYDSKSGKIYVFDAKDYISNGVVLIYNTDGSYYSTIEAGVIPSKIIL